jgi:CubicO group peptidase (beta-lactamase class C family)
LAQYLHKGDLDEQAPVTKYVPELERSGFAGATVRHLLDMQTGIRARCFPSPKELGIYDGPLPAEWRFGSPEFRQARHEFARNCRVQGLFPALAGEADIGYYDFLLTLERDHDHGEYFYYTDPNPIALQWILERTTDIPYVKHVSNLLRSVGAEDRGILGLDNIGTAVGSTGLCLTARDLARWGQMLCNGAGMGGSILPGMRDFVSDVSLNPRPDKWTEKTNSRDKLPQNSGYRSLTWTTPVEPGYETIPFASGAFRQTCFIDRTRKNVIVKFSSLLNVEEVRKERIAVQMFVREIVPEFFR